MPTYFITEEDTETWQNISVCSDCGDVRIKSVEPEDVRRAHERYLEILVEEGVMSEEEIKQELQ